MLNHETWQTVLAELELTISKANFITWFRNTGIIANQQGQVIICVPNAFTRAWLEKKYHQTIIKSLERITGKPIKKMEYKIDNIKNIPEDGATTETPKQAAASAASPTAAYFPKSAQINTNGGFALSPKYTFESFVVGKGSELAFAAAQAVVERPGIAYNPLFVYGGVGLGKTHLIQAIGNEMLKKHPGINIMYVSAEKFSNDFIHSIKDRTAKDFQIRYRHIDLLLIDDIQFIAGKVETQESFFHTFNELHQANKQVILTSDRPPKAIPALEDRLKSRFEWGMIADISAPDFETKVAILAKKCAEKSFELSEKILQTIASNNQTNIRELEGALNKIIVFHQLKEIPPTVESVKSLLSSFGVFSARQSLTPAQLLETAGQFYSLSREEILGKNREKKVSLPRQVIMFLMREELKMSYPAIGDELGGRDHTTAMHAHDKITNELETDLKLKQELEMLRQRMYINNV
ncbi:MAG: chromosomal replication initiator protein DnaA [Candidatus Magasanikbacteria bacterium]|nr:chromosomal replication initiator protein DnaA [Candidatus Magasanikbacteria bacterium]